MSNSVQAAVFQTSFRLNVLEEWVTWVTNMLIFNNLNVEKKLIVIHKLCQQESHLCVCYDCCLIYNQYDEIFHV